MPDTYTAVQCPSCGTPFFLPLECPPLIDCPWCAYLLFASETPLLPHWTPRVSFDQIRDFGAWSWDHSLLDAPMATDREEAAIQDILAAWSQEWEAARRTPSLWPGEYPGLFETGVA
jgi:hypothetical protein